VTGRRIAGFLIVAWSALALGCATQGGGPNVATGEPETYARELLRRRCQSCHRLPRPETKSERAWRDALTRMKRRVALPPADWDSLAALGTHDSTLLPNAR